MIKSQVNETIYCQLASGQLDKNLKDTTSVHAGNKTQNLKLFEPKSTLRLKNKLIEDENNNDDNHNVFGEQRQLHKATAFKYTANASTTELEITRKLLRQQREEQNKAGSDPNEWTFLASDFNRMMHDDWLVTRFLLRGKKMATASLDNNQADCFEKDRAQQAAVYAKTMQLIEVCSKFRYQYRINAQTELSEFPLEWTKVNGMFHYGHDRAGNPVSYMRIALHKPRLIETDSLRHEFKRYLLYVLEKCDQDLYQKPGKAICCVFDMSQAAFENIDLELTTWMIKSFKNCAPKLLCHVIIYNPPWFFTATFKLICNTLLSNNKRQSIKFVCGEEILDYIDYNNLPPYLRSNFM